MVLSGTLVANVLSAILAKETRQIGIMRAIGGSGWAVAGLYSRLTLLLAVLGVLVGLPLGVFVADQFCTMAAGMLNIVLYDRSVSPATVILEVLIGLSVPLLFAALPIRAALTKTTREALGFTGATVGSRSRRVWLGRWFGNPQLQLALQNTFRRRERLALTVAALSVGGAVLMTALKPLPKH